MNKHEQVIYVQGCLYHGCLTVCTNGFTQDPTKHIPRVQLLRPVSQKGTRTDERNTTVWSSLSCRSNYSRYHPWLIQKLVTICICFFYMFYITVLNSFADNQEECLSNSKNTFSMHKEGNSSTIPYLCTICCTQPHLIAGLFLWHTWNIISY